VRQPTESHRALVFVIGLLLLIPALLAGTAKLSRWNPKTNPPQYIAFSRPLSNDDQITHALDRLTFGPRPGDPAAVKEIGLDTWLDGQLHPERRSENPILLRRLAPFDSLRMSIAETYLRYPPAQKGPDNPRRLIASQLVEGKLLRAIYGNRQLEEVLVDFWYNHFNVFLNKGADHYLVPSYERDAIRPHVLGKFHDLLLATAESPAMLFYLDNWQSVAPGAGRKRGLNENYGRELLELHTLGVDGGYTQKDVIEVVRCFTGWTIARPKQGGSFEYNDKVHDKGRKVVLGHTIKPGGGMNDGLEVLKILSRHPSTAHFIALKLAQRFVADDPPPSLVDRMAKTFLKKHGDLREVLHTMLSSPEFWSQGAYRAKIKTPFEMVVSAVRATGADVVSAAPLATQIQKLGEPLYRKIEPTGYSSANAEWTNSAGLLGRINFAAALAHNRLPGIKVDTADELVIGSPGFQKH